MKKSVFTQKKHTFVTLKKREAFLVLSLLENLDSFSTSRMIAINAPRLRWRGAVVYHLVWEVEVLKFVIWLTVLTPLFCILPDLGNGPEINICNDESR
ncbi:MAG TPA: hypothetical protein DEG28_14875 [Porphyromonadaceae bacterium]|nr:hypothetical protein [Porphyromonadaceae bacterium]